MSTTINTRLAVIQRALPSARAKYPTECVLVNIDELYAFIQRVLGARVTNTAPEPETTRCECRGACGGRHRGRCRQQTRLGQRMVMGEGWACAACSARLARQ